MTVKRTVLALLAGAAAALAGAAVAAPVSAPTHASILIRHQVRGCHTWSVNGGRFAASQNVVLARGGTITITNNDMMSHKLVELSGRAALIKNLRTPGMGMNGHEWPGMMGHMGARTRVTFPTAGTYRFTTKVGDDYMPGLKTIGEDNVLRLTVKVT